MIKSASVELIISSSETPGANSVNLKPLLVTSITARSVTIFFTQDTPVIGRVHLLKVYFDPVCLYVSWQL